MIDVPESRRVQVVDNLHGHEIADPYRWLEDDPEDWVRRQNDATEAYLASVPARDWFRRTMAAILGRPRTGVPVHSASTSKPGTAPAGPPRRPRPSGRTYLPSLPTTPGSRH